MLELKLGDMPTRGHYALTLRALAYDIESGAIPSGSLTMLKDGDAKQYGTIIIMLDGTETDGFGG